MKRKARGSGEGGLGRRAPGLGLFFAAMVLLAGGAAALNPGAALARLPLRAAGSCGARGSAQPVAVRRAAQACGVRGASGARMQLEFPGGRREVQQSREYNVARVRGGYYMSDKDGEAPLEEVITSKMADVGGLGHETEQASDEPSYQGLSDEEFAAFVQRQADSAAGDGSTVPKYMPSLRPDDPIVAEIYRLELATDVQSMELLDSRWNGNEVVRYITDQGSLFVKFNRVTDPSVFKAEAVGLTSMLRTKTVTVPKPLHVGKLPKVGIFGPGAFLIAEFLRLQPFGALNSANQRVLGAQLGALHSSRALDDVHKGRYGFVVDNLHSLVPQGNAWQDSWIDFFRSRLLAQVRCFFSSQLLFFSPLLVGGIFPRGRRRESRVAVPPWPRDRGPGWPGPLRWDARTQLPAS
jgi:hypothetical protein